MSSLHKYSNPNLIINDRTGFHADTLFEFLLIKNNMSTPQQYIHNASQVTSQGSPALKRNYIQQ